MNAPRGAIAGSAVPRFAAALCIAGVLGGLGGCDWLISDRTKLERARTQLAQGNVRDAVFNLKSVLQHNPADGPARLELARLSLTVGDADGAATELARALDAGIPPGSVGSLAVDILLARGQYQQALQRLAVDTSLPAPRRAARTAAAQLALGSVGAARETLQRALAGSPDSAELLVELAKIDIREQNFGNAAQAIARAVAHAPDSAEAWLIAGSLKVHEGDYRGAESAFTRGRQAGEVLHDFTLPQLGMLLGGLVETRLAIGDGPGAVQALNELDARLPGTPPTHYMRARLLMAADNPRAAAAELQRALLAAPDYVAARRLLGAALLADGSLEQASAELSQVLSSHPDDNDARKLLVEVELARKRPDVAQRILAEAGISSRGDPQFDWLLGTALITAGSESGIAYLEKSLSALPAGAGPRIELAAAYLMAGRRSDALGVLEAIPATERTPQVRRLIVFANIIHRPKDEALNALRDLVANYPSDAPLLGAAGAYALSVGQYDVAESYLERSRQLDPRDVLPRMALAQLAVGRGQLGRAEHLLRETIAVDPHAQAAYLGLSGLRWAQGGSDEAQQLLQQAIAADPGAVAPRLRFAQIAFATGEPARGRALLDQAANLAPNNAEVGNAMGEVLLATGHLDEALSRFSAASAAGSARAKLNVARTEMALGKLEEARRLLEAAAADPHGDRLEPGVLLVGLDARQGRAADALGRLAGLRRAGLPEADADELTGDIYVVAGRFVDASKAYELAASKRPSSSLVVKVFRVRQALNTPDPHREVLRWLESSPADRLVRWELAEYLQRIGHRDAAINEYERLRQGPGARDPVLLNNLACLYLESKDPRAAELGRAAHDLAPEAYEITDTYGWILVKTGQLEPGMELLRKAARGAPENADIAYHVAAGTAYLGDKAKARELLARLLHSKVAFASRPEAEALRNALAAQ